MKHIVPYLTLVLTLAFAISPALTDPFSGFSPDQLPNPQIDPPVQPAGYAFAIWGLIYAWLTVSAIFGAFQRRDADHWHRAQLPLCGSLAIGVPWLAIANASAIWATITIFLMAAFAILALIRSDARDRWLLQAPIAIYAGWLTAASFVSLGSTAAGYNIAFDAIGWAYAGILGALVVALVVSARRSGAPEYLLTVIWALIGIIVANQSDPLGVTLLAAAGAAVLLAQAIRRRAPS